MESTHILLYCFEWFCFNPNQYGFTPIHIFEMHRNRTCSAATDMYIDGGKGIAGKC